MAVSSTHEVTRLLVAWSAGDQEALAQLAPLVEAQLERLAHAYMRRERAAHTLQTEALVNEAYVRLIDWQAVEWQDHAHFFGVAASLMRKVLVDYARRRGQEKRAGALLRVSLSAAADEPQPHDPDLVALDDALRTLAAFDPRQSHIVELRFFGGLTEKEVAEVLQISERTVRREWNMAQAWLYHELQRNKSD
jgi:RNA polymerase sigma factor (TIGR02999 family)